VGETTVTGQPPQDMPEIRTRRKQRHGEGALLPFFAVSHLQIPHLIEELRPTSTIDQHEYAHAGCVPPRAHGVGDSALGAAIGECRAEFVAAAMRQKGDRGALLMVVQSRRMVCVAGWGRATQFLLRGLLRVLREPSPPGTEKPPAPSAQVRSTRPQVSC
jgi:hypothetical protein